MREADQLEREELAGIVRSIQQFLYLDTDDTGATIWDPEKPCSGGDLFDHVATLFNAYGLMPEEHQQRGKSCRREGSTASSE